MALDSDSPFSSNAPSTSEDIAEQWEKVRKAFHTSIMVDTSLSSLAQSLEGADWPLKSPSETPSKYIDLSYEELLLMPAFTMHPERVPQLLAILQETLAFDEPFGEMVADNPGADDRSNPILKNFAKLEIPEDLPISLVALTQETREYCELEHIATLKDFAIFAQGLSQNVIVGGDFRAFLNAISHIDQVALAQFLPFRPGLKGLHLMEGLALTARGYSTEIQAALAGKYGARLGAEDKVAAKNAPSEELAAAEDVLTRQASAYVEYFRADLANLQLQINDGVPLMRLASELKHPLVESVVTGLLRPYLTLPAANAPSRTTTPPLADSAVPIPKKRGFFASLGGLFKK